jgi:hypothetical protein
MSSPRGIGAGVGHASVELGQRQRAHIEERMVDPSSAAA